MKHMNIRPIADLLIYALLIFGLISCQDFSVRDENSPYYKPPIGSSFVLNRDIDIPPNEVSVYLQYGKIILEKDIQVREANCKFEVRDLLPMSQTVRADTFEITRIQLTTDYVAFGRMIVASVMNSDSDAPIAEVYAATYYLKSPIQPNVRYLTCQHWEIPGSGNHLSVAQIREALGNIITLKISEHV